MILELFIVLIGICLVMVFLGFKFEVPAYTTIGFFLMFLLSFVILSNNLQYQSGNIVDTPNATTTIITYTYDNYNDSSTHWFGYFLAVGSSIGMISSFFLHKRGDVRR